MALDFPNIPVNGQVYDNFIYDATKGTWKSLSSGASPNFLVNPTITNAVITATATTPSTVPITVNGAASQSANLQEWRNSAGVVLSDIDNLGNVQTPRIGLGGLAPHATHILDSSGRMKIRSNGSNSSGIWLTGTDGTETAFMGMLGNLSSDSVGFFHNSAWRLIVDSSGRVTMPSQPTFFAYQPESGTFMTAGGIPIFTITNVNIGSNYNTSNGRFTAPIAGTYQFQAMMLLRTNTNPGEATFFRNGANVVSRNLAYSMPVGTNAHDPVHFMTYINLAVGDFVDVRVSTPGGGADWYFGGGLGWFSGRLVG